MVLFRELESEVLNLRNQRQDDDLVSDLTRQLTAQQQSHDEEARYMRSELHKLRSQVGGSLNHIPLFCWVTWVAVDLKRGCFPTAPLRHLLQ